MEKLTRLFGRSIRFAYHCFDRIVIRGYLSTLSRPENIEYFFRTLKQVTRYTHLYFYVIDEVLGPFAMRIGAYLPFYATYYLNGHDIIAPMLKAEGVRFRMKENAFVSVSDPVALQTAADHIDPHRIQEQLDYWTFMLGPKFSQYEKDNTFLRIETCSNNLKDFQLRKKLDHLPLVIVRNRILNPIAGSIFVRSPDASLKPNSILQAQYRRTARSFNDLVALLKTA